MTYCVNCPHPAVQRHHVIYAQELRRRAKGRAAAELLADTRGLVPVCKRCHERHHTRFSPLSASVLPDSAFEFAVELMGAGAAFEYIRRRYRGPDPRLDALLEEKAA